MFSATDSIDKIKYIDNNSGNTITATLKITEQSASYGSSVYTVVLLESREPRLNGVKLKSFIRSNSQLKTGDRITAKIKLQKIDKDSRSDSFADKIYGGCSILEVKNTLKPDKALKLIFKLRDYVSDTLYKEMANDNATVVNALLTGNKLNFSNELSQSVKNAGVSHVMAVSGLHLSIIIGTLNRFLNIFCKNKYIRFCITTLAILMIAAVCGFTMSVMRAGFMLLFSYISIFFGRERDSVSALGMAVILLLIHSPFALYSVALQLSSLATFGIIVIAPSIVTVIKDVLKIKYRLFLELLQLCIVTASATIMTLPVSIYNFSCISSVSLLSNLLINHAVSAVLSLSVAALVILLVRPFDVIARFLFLLCGFITRYITAVIKLLGTENAAFSIDQRFSVIAWCIIIVLLILIDTCKKRSHLLKLKESNKTKTIK